MLLPKFTGSLLGLACGDALGQPVEAIPPERIRRDFGEVRDFLPGDPRLPLPLGAGQWTDDTQMALDIARSIVRCGRVDGADIAHEFVRDHEEHGIRFSGFTVTYALKRMRRGVAWDRSGLDDEQSAGNGAAMRVAPVALFHLYNLDSLFEAARVSSIMTHRHPEAIAGARAVAYVIARAAAGTLDLEQAVADTVRFIGPCAVAENLIRAGELLAEGVETAEALAVLKTSGYVVHTVAAAALCFLKCPNDFERSVVDAVMGGNDADTTAAVTGAMSGAFNGEDAIPRRWRDQVKSAQEIRALAEALWRTAGGP